MVSRVLRFLLLTAIAGLLPQLTAKELADYRIGDTVASNIVAPVRLIVTNPEATEALKDKEAQKVYVICRYYPKAVDEAEGALRQAFASARSNFLDRVEEAFKQRKLDAQAVASEKFRKLVADYESMNKFAPLNFKLAATWAQSQSDADFQDPLVAHLRAAMDRSVRPDHLPEGIKLTYTLRLAVMTNLDVEPTLETVDRQDTTITRTNVITLSRQRIRLLRSFPEDEQLWAKFTAGFLRENLVPDAELTHQARDEQTTALQVADTYEAGQLIAKRGDVIDRKIMAAIDQVQQITARTHLEHQLTTDQAMAAATRQRNRWLIVALAAVSLFAVVIVWQFRRRQTQTLLPARMAAGEIAAPQSDSDLRAHVAPHLARLMMNKLFRRLISQRSQMIATQEMAATEMAELEAQLEKVRAPLEERLRTYEKRIADLEKELAVRGEENRELLKAKIFLVKKQLETERAKNRLEFN